MRHKYPTEAIVLARHPLAEESALLTLLTRELGLVRARAQGVRKPGAKLSAALQTFSETEVVLIAGKEGWRVSGALLQEAWFTKLSRTARTRAGRIASLLLRLVHGESPDPHAYDIFRNCLIAFSEFPEEQHDAIECLAALQLLSILGLDAGEVPATFTEEALTSVANERTAYIARVNRGITASGL